MANLVFYIDHLPLLSRSLNKSAIVIYMYFDKFKNDKQVVQISYSDLRDHLGFSSATIQKSLQILKKLSLIEEIKEGRDLRHRLLPVIPLSQEKKHSLCVELGIEIDHTEDTKLAKRYLEEDIPIEFQQLLNKKLLQKLYKQLGTLKKPKDICRHLKLDFNTFKLLHERIGKDSFGQRFEALVRSIETNNTSTTKKFGEDERELATHLYDQLKKLGIKPTSKSWFMKNCNIAKELLNNASLEELKASINWGFEDDWWKDKLTDLSSLHTIYPRYKLSKNRKNQATNTIARSTLIPAEILSKVQLVSPSIPLKTYEDAFILKQSILDGQDRPEIIQAVEILEKHGIIPEGSNNLKFG